MKFSITTFTVKALTLFLILFYASAKDILYREVPDFVSVMILILAVSDISDTSLGDMVLGFLAVFVPQIAIAMLFPKKAIGGADIKISSCSAFLLGAEKGVLALIIGLAIAVIVMSVMSKLKHQDKNKSFPLVPCITSLVMVVVGCVAAIMLDNYFLIPIFSVAFATVPFLYVKNTLSAYDKHIKEEMETAISIITTSYMRSEDILNSVNENISYLKLPLKDIFQGFIGDALMVSSDTKKALKNLKGRIDNDIFSEWCDALIACQDDRTLKDTLLPIVEKLTDVGIVNNELKTMLSEVKKEYWAMVALVIGNIDKFPTVFCSSIIVNWPTSFCSAVEQRTHSSFER